MYPHERSLVKNLADKPFAIIGVNSDKDLEGIRKTSAEKSITWRSFWNGEKGTRGPISEKWMVTGWPTTYLIDKDGVIRYKNVRGKSLDKAIQTLMAEMGEEVNLVDVDHEAEDKAAMKTKAEAKKKAAEEAGAKAAEPRKEAGAKEAEAKTNNAQVEEKPAATEVKAEPKAKTEEKAPAAKAEAKTNTEVKEEAKKEAKTDSK